MRVHACATVLFVWLVAGLAMAADSESGWPDYLKLSVNNRVRFEFVDWFRPAGSAALGEPERYSFMANRLRVGARVTFPNWQAELELQDTRIIGLPNDANRPAPVGSLGPGAIYYAHTRDRNQGSTFIKKGYLTWRRSGLSLSGGRMEIAEGLETIPGNRTLAELKKMRIAQRLLGPFGYTHVSRSFDAARLAWDRPSWNLTAFGGRPTRGGFEVSANQGLDDVHIAGLAWTQKSIPLDVSVDLRAFYLMYRDNRDAPVVTDNRALAVRRTDNRPIEVHTVGGHALIAEEWGPGTLDGLVWFALQGGDWGRLDHFGWAFAIEAGYRFARIPGSPWLRLGWNRSSGDDDPTDSDHETFFQVMPTARIYARFPFFNAMNNDDLFAQLLIEPHPLIRLRVEYHYLRLIERDDLWYAGGGATNERIFGFGGTPSGGDTDLAHLVDIGATTGPFGGITFGAYYGHAFGRDVIANTFARADADYFFFETVVRY